MQLVPWAGKRTTGAMRGKTFNGSRETCSREDMVLVLLVFGWKNGMLALIG